MVAQLKIDQAGLSPGSPGVARTDGKADGSLVTLTNDGEGATTAFRLLWTPPGDVDAVGSLAATEGDPKVWTFSPTPGRYGTYEVELIENAGLTSEKRERRAFVVRTPYLGLVIPALNERGNKSSSLVASGDTDIVDNNSQDDPDPDLAALDFAGWWRAQHALIMAVDALLAPVRVTHYSDLGVGDGGPPVPIRQAFGSLGAALAATYEIGTAVVDVQPNRHAVDLGPILLEGPAEYLIRGAVGRRSAVCLPSLSLQTRVAVEACAIQLSIVSTAALELRDVVVFEAVAADVVDARDSTFAGAAAFTISSTASFDRCAFDVAAAITCSAPVDGRVTLTNCTFAAGPSIVFTEGVNVGVVRMDARSKFLWDAAGGSVTNGAPIVVEAPP